MYYLIVFHGSSPPAVPARRRAGRRKRRVPVARRPPVRKHDKISGLGKRRRNHGHAPVYDSKQLNLVISCPPEACARHHPATFTPTHKLNSAIFLQVGRGGVHVTSRTLPLKRWRCSGAWAAAAGLPGCGDPPPFSYCG